MKATYCDSAEGRMITSEFAHCWGDGHFSPGTRFGVTGMAGCPLSVVIKVNRSMLRCLNLAERSSKSYTIPSAPKALRLIKRGTALMPRI